MKWHPNLPKKDGLYWFVRGRPIGGRPLVLDIRGEYRYVFGPNGSIPLNMLWKSGLDVQYAVIPSYKEWQSLDCIRGDTPSWLKDVDGNIGFGIVSHDGQKGSYGNVAWLNTQSAFVAGGFRDCMYSPVKYPIYRGSK